MDNTQTVLKRAADALCDYSRVLMPPRSDEMVKLADEIAKLPGMPAEDWRRGFMQRVHEYGRAVRRDGNPAWESDEGKALLDHARQRIQPAASEADADSKQRILDAVKRWATAITHSAKTEAWRALELRIDAELAIAADAASEAGAVPDKVAAVAATYGVTAQTDKQTALTCEHRRAIKEGQRIAATEEYFSARGRIDTPLDRRVFEAGFDRGYDAAPPAPSQQAGADADDIALPPLPLPAQPGERGKQMQDYARTALASAPVAGEAQPAAWVAADTLNSPHPTCISSLAYMSQLDRERGREYVPLYAAPVAAQASADMFWSVDNPEEWGGESLHDAVHYAADVFSANDVPFELTFQAAKRMPNVRVRVTGYSESDGWQYEIIDAALAAAKPEDQR